MEAGHGGLEGAASASALNSQSYLAQRFEVSVRGC